MPPLGFEHIISAGERPLDWQLLVLKFKMQQKYVYTRTRNR